MKKLFLLTIAFICLLLAGCSSSGDYKECSYIKADNVELSANESTRELVRFVCESAEIKELYVTSGSARVIKSNNDSKIRFNDNEYIMDVEVGELYFTKTFIKYNEKLKKAIEIDEYNINISLPKNIYESLANKEIFIPEGFIDRSFYNYDYTGMTEKLEYSKIESKYDLSGSSSIQYIYA